MMWIQGVNPAEVLHAYVAAGVALLICGVIAAKQQQRYSPILKNAHEHTRVDWVRVGIGTFILAAAITVNVVVNLRFDSLSGSFPFIEFGVWIAILLTWSLRQPDWEVLPETFKGSVFYLRWCLVRR